MSSKKCPRCGHDKFEEVNKGDVRNTFLMCLKCGRKSIPQVFESKANKNPFLKKSQSISLGDNTKPASDKPFVENTPESNFKSFDKKKKKRDIPINEDLRPENDEETIRSFSMNNPFVKSSKKNPFVKTKKCKCGCEIKKDQIKCLKCEEAKLQNPFIRKARTEQLTNRQKIDNTLYSQDGNNSTISPVFDHQTAKEKNIAPWRTFNWHTHFAPTDRMEYRHSPDPKEFIPGYEEWYNEEVDKFYDGWVEDHIENSGGKIIGGNQDRTMNLNEGERNYSPRYPEDAGYEKLLENRHHFGNDYEEVIAKTNPFLKKSQILGQINPEEIQKKLDVINPINFSDEHEQLKIANALILLYREVGGTENDEKHSNDAVNVISTLQNAQKKKLGKNFEIEDFENLKTEIDLVIKALSLNKKAECNLCKKEALKKKQ